MPLVELALKNIDIDAEGYLKEFDQWNEEIALSLALREDIEYLTPAHWYIINHIRTFYKRNGTSPMVRRLCRETKITLEKLYRLFPTGLARGACKIAGLPRPVGCT